MDTENIIFQTPKGWREALKNIAKKQQLPSYSYLLRRDMADKYPELKDIK